MNQLLRRLDGVSAAFIRELLRKSAVYAAETQHDDQLLSVNDEHIDEALGDLLVTGGPLT